jgi:hypothetical protein
MERLGYLHQDGKERAVRIIDYNKQKDTLNHEGVELEDLPIMPAGITIWSGPNMEGEFGALTQPMPEWYRQAVGDGYYKVTLVGPDRNLIEGYIHMNTTEQ